MKAVSVLLFLALPAAIVGKMFNQYAPPQYPQMGRLVVNPLDYIDQYQYKATEDGSPASNENSRETNADVASYIQKYIEVLNYDKENKKQRKSKKNEKTDQQLIQQIAAQARLSKLREYDQLAMQRGQQYAPQYMAAYSVQPGQVFSMPMYKQGDSQEILSEIKYDGDNSQKYVKESRFAGDNSQKYMKETRFTKNQKPVYRQAQYAPEQTRFQEMPSEETRKIPSYGDAISWRGLAMAAGQHSAVATKEDIEKIYGDAYSTMNHYSEEAKMQFHKDFEMAASRDDEEIHLNATEMMKKHEYNVEEHTVQTDDGYILTMFRIAPGGGGGGGGAEAAPVLLVHGLPGSADDWLLQGQDSLPYRLAAAGRDVWLANTRGSKYSRHHVAKHPALDDFWQFSIDEVALHDLPAMIDYTLRTTRQQKLVYVGHAQGTTAFFALAASRPAYGDKVAMMHALSPMAYMTHTRSPLLKMIAPTSAFSERLQRQIGRGEFRPSAALLATIGGALCEKEIGCKFVCSNLNFVMSGVNMEQLNASRVPAILAHSGAGASARLMKQLGQAVASNEFRMYDYGSEMNARVYGSVQPPRYQLGAVSAPVSLYHSAEDWLAAPADVARLRRELPAGAVADQYQVPEQDFGSWDFLVGKAAPALYARIVDSILNNTAIPTY